jgi:hypothetical protein
MNNSPVRVQASGGDFDRYVLDLDRGSLFCDGNEMRCGQDLHRAALPGQQLRPPCLERRACLGE